MMLDGGERALLRRRIDCPVSWCSGRWLDHGGDGGDPSTWLHEDEREIDLGFGAVMHRSQVGGGAVEWSLAVRVDGGSIHSLSPAAPGAYARALRAIADAIEVSVGSPDAVEGNPR